VARVRITFDAGKPAAETADAFTLLEADPTPIGTADWVAAQFGGTKVKTKAISTPSGQLMHSKHLIRDRGTAGAAIWTGSANFTNGAWTLQQNSIVTIATPTRPYGDERAIVAVAAQLLRDPFDRVLPDQDVPRQ
jgi:hypothetical protein